MGKKRTPLEEDVLAPNYTGAPYFNIKWTGQEGNSTAVATSISDDGSVRKTVSYQNGKKHGKEITQESFDGSTVTAVYNQGQLTQVTYEQVATFPYTVYYKDGQPHHTDKYDAVTFTAIQDLGVLGNPNIETTWSGKKGDSVLSVYNENGDLIRTSEHKNGLRHGEEITYDFSQTTMPQLPQNNEMMFDERYNVSDNKFSVRYYHNGVISPNRQEERRNETENTTGSLTKTLASLGNRFVDDQNVSIDLTAWLNTNYNNNSMG